MQKRGNVIWLVARHELRAARRGRLVPIFGAVFALLSLIIALAGLGASGQLLVQGFLRTAVSLLNVASYLLPLVGLLIGAATVSGDEGGTELLLAQPVYRSDVMLGRIAGLVAALWLIAAAGFGSCAALVALSAGTAGLGGYLLVLAAATTVGTAGVALGVLIGTMTRRRATAVGGALAAWFALAVLYDLAAIAVLQVAGDGHPGPWLLALLAANPIDGLRALTLLRLGADVLLGPTSAALQALLSPAWATALVLVSAAASIALPVLFSLMVYRKKDF